MRDAGYTDPTEITTEVERYVRAGASFEELQSDLQDYLSIEELVGIDTADDQGGHSPAWSVRTATAIRIIREERRKVRREADREREREARDRERARKARRGLTTT